MDETIDERINRLGKTERYGPGAEAKAHANGGPPEDDPPDASSPDDYGFEHDPHDGDEKTSAKTKPGADSANAPKRWTFKRAQDFEYGFEQRRYAIKHVIPHPGQVLVYGPPKCGKTLVVEDWAHHIGAGCSYRGLLVVGGPVAYLSLEGKAAMEDRIEARRQAHEKDPDVAWGDVRYTFDALNLIHDQEELIRRLGEEFPDGMKVAIIDTLNRSMDGDENSAQDMRAYLGAAERIMKEFNCTVIIIHHCGRNGERPRGSTAIDGSMDLLVRVSKQEDDTVVAVIEAAKEMKAGLAIVSCIESRYIGKDADGEPYFACIAAPPEASTGITNKDAIVDPAEKKNGTKKPEKRNVALELLQRLIAEQGISFTPDADERKAKVLAVTEIDWLDRYRTKMQEEPDKKRKPESIDRLFRGAKKALLTSRIIDVYAGKVWLVSDEQQDRRYAEHK